MKYVFLALLCLSIAQYAQSASTSAEIIIDSPDGDVSISVAASSYSYPEYGYEVGYATANVNVEGGDPTTDEMEVGFSTHIGTGYTSTSVYVKELMQATQMQAKLQLFQLMDKAHSTPQRMYMFQPTTLTAKLVLTTTLQLILKHMLPKMNQSLTWKQVSVLEMSFIMKKLMFMLIMLTKKVMEAVNSVSGSMLKLLLIMFSEDSLWPSLSCQLWL